MSIYFYGEIKIRAKEQYQIIDLTEEVKSVVKSFRVFTSGRVSIRSLHTTTAVFVNENEEGLWEDFENVAKHILPDDMKFQHDNVERRRVNNPNLPQNECKNGRAHCLSIIFDKSPYIELRNGKLNLGPWQRILFWEFDKPKKRRIAIVISEV